MKSTLIGFALVLLTFEVLRLHLEMKFLTNKDDCDKQHDISKPMLRPVEQAAVNLSKPITHLPEQTITESKQKTDFSSPGESTEWAFVLTITAGFIEMFQNWYAFYSDLKMTNSRLIIIAEDEKSWNTLNDLKKSSKAFDFDELIKGYEYDALGNDINNTTSQQKSHLSGAYTYNSAQYRTLASRRAAHLIRVLRRYPQILFTDVDTVLLSDPTVYLVDDKNGTQYDIFVTIDVPPKGVCGGFLAFRATRPSFELLQMWAKVLARSDQTNQGAFNSILWKNSMNLATKILPDDKFRSGLMYFDFNKTEGAVWVHNNWIKGYENKVTRFKNHKLWKVDEHH